MFEFIKACLTVMDGDCDGGDRIKLVDHLLILCFFLVGGFDSKGRLICEDAAEADALADFFDAMYGISVCQTGYDDEHYYVTNH